MWHAVALPAVHEHYVDHKRRKCTLHGSGSMLLLQAYIHQFIILFAFVYSAAAYGSEYQTGYITNAGNEQGYVSYPQEGSRNENDGYPLISGAVRNAGGGFLRPQYGIMPSYYYPQPQFSQPQYERPRNDNKLLTKIVELLEKMAKPRNTNTAMGRGGLRFLKKGKKIIENAIRNLKHIVKPPHGPPTLEDIDLMDLPQSPGVKGGDEAIVPELQVPIVNSINPTQVEVTETVTIIETATTTTTTPAAPATVEEPQTTVGELQTTAELATESTIITEAPETPSSTLSTVQVSGNRKPCPNASLCGSNGISIKIIVKNNRPKKRVEPTFAPIVSDGFCRQSCFKENDKNDVLTFCGSKCWSKHRRSKSTEVESKVEDCVETCYALLIEDDESSHG